MMLRLQGISAGSGVAVGPVHQFRKQELRVERTAIMDPELELERLDAALTQARHDLETLAKKTARGLGEKEAEVFQAHLLFLVDPALVGEVRARIQAELVSAAWAFRRVGAELANTLASLPNEYLKERAADVRDVADRVVRILLAADDESLIGLQDPVVIVAPDLTPSETAQLDRRLILGFATEDGGPTSHTAIMARTLGIPAIVGLGSLPCLLNNGDLVALDGNTGELVIRPDVATLADFRERERLHRLHSERLLEQAGNRAVTADGCTVEVGANIGVPGEAAEALRWGAEGIGLLRTEFLYLDRDTLPTEEDQYRAYRAVLETMGPERPVTIRTLDIGGDKHLEALPIPAEENPFLGVRGIRVCLAHPELLKTQLRALLRAAVHGQLRIMYPMIQSLHELQAANTMLEAARRELNSEGHDQGNLEVGIMVEVPAAAVIADLLAPHVDFFSIGTNDLIQYTLAVDRLNERVSHLYEPFHPAVLRLIHQVCSAGRRSGKWVGMCGEMAGDAMVAPVLLGFGLSEWSMSASKIPAVKEALRRTRRDKAVRFARTLLREADPAQIRNRVRAFNSITREHRPSGNG